MNNPNLLPIRPLEVPIVPITRWQLIRDDTTNIQYLRKVFIFNDPNKFLEFTRDILEYQLLINHYADISTKYVPGDNVHEVYISIWTRTIDQVTNLDKEFARYADITFNNLTHEVLSHVAK